MGTDGRRRRIPMGKKSSKPRKLPPGLSSATSSLPEPLQAAVDATSKLGALKSLRYELDAADPALGHSEPSDAPAGHFRPGAGHSSNRPKTSLPVVDILLCMAGRIEAALEIYESTDSESVKAHAAQWIRVIMEHTEDSGRHQPLIYGVSVLSQPRLVASGGLEWYAPFLPDFWRCYAAHAEFACELIAAIIRWDSCRGDSSEERIKKFLINRPGITVGGEVFMVHSGITSSGGTLPPTATDQQICEAFREFTGQDVSPKLVGNARQRWFGKDQQYRADLVRRVALFLK